MPRTFCLNVKWSTLRSPEYYGWSRCRIRDASGNYYKDAIGGGYDLLGTALGNWAEKELQPELMQQTLRPGLMSHKHVKGGGFSVLIDGGVGESAVVYLIEACGFTVNRLHDKRRTTGYLIAENEKPPEPLPEPKAEPLILETERPRRRLIRDIHKEKHR